MMDNHMDAWRGFQGTSWRESINVRDFIQQNFKPYYGDDRFLSSVSADSAALWEKVRGLMQEELEAGVLDLDTEVVSMVDSHGPGYIDQARERIVGLQTDKPLKRALMPYGGIRMAEAAAASYGYQVDRKVVEIFSKHRKTHNEGVFDAYTADMRKARKSGIITGLPDAYGRGRIIGDYRRVALYGIQALIEERQAAKRKSESAGMDEATIRDREELSDQIKALKQLLRMAESYGYDLSGPAGDAQEAFQWTYFAYLAATKEQNGAAMSLGRVSTFLDIYLERDLQLGLLSEDQAQELVDQFVMKLRMIRCSDS